MTSLELHEPVHLEAWIVAHPEALGADLKIVTTQFNSWESGQGHASDRPDVLALSSTGELVVIELKRGGDKRVHLQAITYGALAATFTAERLAAAHAHWLHARGGAQISTDAALSLLREHVDGDWEDAILELPRLVLVAEAFPAQVLTTVNWLARAAPDLSIECHQYVVFESGSEVFVTFERLLPVRDLADQMLSAGERETKEAREVISGNKRRAKSVTIIAENNLIPDGSIIDLDLVTRARPEVVERINSWLDESVVRREVRWRSDPVRPLTWGAAEDPEERWTPSALRNEIFRLAGADAPNFSAADAWSYQGLNFYQLANQATVGD